MLSNIPPAQEEHNHVQANGHIPTANGHIPNANGHIPNGHLQNGKLGFPCGSCFLRRFLMQVTSLMARPLCWTWRNPLPSIPLANGWWKTALPTWTMEKSPIIWMGLQTWLREWHKWAMDILGRHLRSRYLLVWIMDSDMTLSATWTVIFSCCGRGDEEGCDDVMMVVMVFRAGRANIFISDGVVCSKFISWCYLSPVNGL